MFEKITGAPGILGPRVILLSVIILGGGSSLRVEAQDATASLNLEIGVESTVALDTLFQWEPTILLDTTQGTIPIELTPTTAPLTVENFLFYVDSGRYADSFIHRSASLQDGSPFVIQGGGFFFDYEVDPVRVEVVPTEDPVENEFNVSNTRGTVAMAKLGDDPDSATSQWFINLSDNGSILDDQNGGFTVFGRVIGEGMIVADAISEIPTYNATEQLGSPFGELPLTDSVLNTENFVVIDTVSRYAPDLSIEFPAGGADRFETNSSNGVLAIEALPGASGTYVLELTATFLEGPPQVELLELSVAPEANWYADASEIQPPGWRYYDWFKGFKPEAGSNWIFHGRHGWLFVLADDTSGMFLWDVAIGRWMFTNETAYPWMYAYGPNEGWVFFFEGGRPGSRFFKRGDTGETISEEQLRVNP